MDLMAAAIRRALAAGDPDRGDTYCHHWCAALESFCFEKRWISPEIYQQLLSEWGLAIARTSHGVPLVLEKARAFTGAGDEDLREHDHHYAHAHVTFSATTLRHDRNWCGETPAQTRTRVHAS